MMNKIQMLTIDEHIAGNPRLAGDAGPAAAAHGGGAGDAGHHAAGLGPAPVPQHRARPRRHLRLDTALPHPQLAARQEKTLTSVDIIAICLCVWIYMECIIM